VQFGAFPLPFIVAGQGQPMNDSQILQRPILKTVKT